MQFIAGHRPFQFVRHDFDWSFALRIQPTPAGYTVQIVFYLPWASYITFSETPSDTMSVLLHFSFNLLSWSTYYADVSGSQSKKISYRLEELRLLAAYSFFMCYEAYEQTDHMFVSDCRRSFMYFNIV